MQMRSRLGLPEVVSIGLVAVLFAVLLAQVVLRPFGLGFVWAEEFAAFAFIALVFFSMAAAHHRGEHMSVEAFQEWAAPRLSPRTRRVWRAGLLVVELLFLVLLSIGLGQMAVQTWGSFAGSLSGFRYGWLYLGVLAAAAISVVALATQLVAEIRRAPEWSYS
jgi:TRAP-type C4-dicarboxylate transport system permease small subunit